LGIITYELVLGKLSHGQIHLSIMPKGLQKILAKALQQNPDDRYQDIVDFMTDISTYLYSPALLKENKELDPLSDLSESLRHAQYSLVPQTPPKWAKIEIGLATYKSLGTSSLYYDFFNLPHQGYGIIIGDPSVKGSAGIVYTSILRGMVRALCQLTQKPEEMATVLNALLINDPMKQNFSFSYLTLSPQENCFRFISCGCGHLWYLPKEKLQLEPIISENPSLGTNLLNQFTEITHPWNVGDTILFYGSNKSSLFSNEQLQASLQEATINTSSQKQVDSILRKVKVELSRTADERSLVLLNLHRKE
jgi:serine phosphatase RsbU (regulator of sigma subunit)